MHNAYIHVEGVSKDDYTNVVKLHYVTWWGGEIHLDVTFNSYVLVRL